MYKDDFDFFLFLLETNGSLFVACFGNTSWIVGTDD